MTAPVAPVPRRATLKRIDPTSLAKLQAVVGAALGLIVGALVSVGFLAGGGTMASMGVMERAFGLAAIVAFPLVYGLVGFVAGAVGAVVYNAAAGRMGGISFEVE